MGSRGVGVLVEGTTGAVVMPIRRVEGSVLRMVPTRTHARSQRQSNKSRDQRRRRPTGEPRATPLATHRRPRRNCRSAHRRHHRLELHLHRTRNPTPHSRRDPRPRPSCTNTSTSTDGTASPTPAPPPPGNSDPYEHPETVTFCLWPQRVDVTPWAGNTGWDGLEVLWGAVISTLWSRQRFGIGTRLVTHSPRWPGRWRCG